MAVLYKFPFVGMLRLQAGKPQAEKGKLALPLAFYTSSGLGSSLPRYASIQAMVWVAYLWMLKVRQ